MAENDPGSLDRLHDIATPPPLSWWPLSPGWYVVGAFFLILLGAVLWATFDRWRRNGYRRAALQELGQLAPTPASLPAVAIILKRTALAAYGRDQVAALTGQVWLAFLDATGGRQAFSSRLGWFLEAATFERNPQPPSDTELAELLAAVRHWIRCHRC